MRKLKRWLRRIYAEWRIRPRRAALAAEIQSALGLKALPALTPSGARGHDSTYIVKAEGKTLGVLRLNNPYKKRTPPAPDMPFALEEPAARIAREWAAYEKGAASGLTPKPLWRTSDALLCEYLPFATLQSRLERDPAAAWEILKRATQAIHALHQSGLTHMDICLPNMLADDKLEKIFFIDFEYAPAPGVSPATQRVYDQLRLLDSAWKFIPASERAQWPEWLKLVKSGAGNDLAAADLSRLAPALERVMGEPQLAAALKA
jgi:hypothetical protein